MGTYLPKPVTKKVSEDMESDRVQCGASSMQGWRESQEDSHNCILNFDRKVSLFAVYDGHGGSEVAQYASSKLPSMVKNKHYENLDFANALKKAYLDFDDSLLKQSVVDELNIIREKIEEEKNTADEDEYVEDDDKIEELKQLYEEAKIPIEDIIMKYRNEKLKIEDSDKDGQSSSSGDPSMSLPQSSNSGSICDQDKNNTSGSSGSSSVTGNNHLAESSSCSKVNGTLKSDEQKKRKSVDDSSEAECGSSSNNGQNGSRKKLGISCLIAEDDSEDSDDSDDEMFEISQSDNQTNELEERDDSDSDSDLESEEDDDHILFNANYDDENEQAGKDSGCTAVMALLIKKKLYVANAGDSRCVVSIDGKAHDMSKDHKPEDELELNRIKAAGGKVTKDGRVNGGLNLSRALGDHNYKKNENLPNTHQMITALPDLSFLDLKKVNADFIVLACDGIWNSLSSQEVVDFVLERIDQPDVKLSSICEELFDLCLAPNTLSDGTGCDNMTCIIVKLKPKNKRSLSVEMDNCGMESKNKKPKIELEVNPEPVLEVEPVREPESVHIPEPVHVPEPEPEIRCVPKPDLILETEAALQSAAANSTHAAVSSSSSAASSASAAIHTPDAVNESEAVHES